MASDKFKAMVHYIVATCEDSKRLGAVRLNKICWFSDTLSYRFTGASMTGETYIKRKFGPVPKTILGALRELQDEKKIGIFEHEVLPSRTMRMFVPLTEAPKQQFNPEELRILDYVIDHVCNHHTANSISELSHDSIWDAANDGEEIPMCATLVATPAELTPEVIEWARAVMKRVSGERSAA
jgi:antitoxin SocA-like protein